MNAITHYQANINIPGHHFDERAPLSDQAALDLANNGSTPNHVSQALSAKAERLKAALLAGKVVTTKTATISPLTTADFRAGRLTPITGAETI